LQPDTKDCGGKAQRSLSLSQGREGISKTEEGKGGGGGGRENAQ